MGIALEHLKVAHLTRKNIIMNLISIAFAAATALVGLVSGDASPRFPNPYNMRDKGMVKPYMAKTFGIESQQPHDGICHSALQLLSSGSGLQSKRIVRSCVNQDVECLKSGRANVTNASKKQE